MEARALYRRWNEIRVDISHGVVDSAQFAALINAGVSPRYRANSARVLHNEILVAKPRNPLRLSQNLIHRR